MKKLRLAALWMLLGAAMPLLLQAQITETYTFTTNRLVPDGDASGLSDARLLNSGIGNITSVTLHLKTTGEFNGDLYGYLVHSNGFAVLLNRPGKTASNPAGFADSGFDITFQTGAANGDIHTYQNVTTPTAGSPLTGTWQPDERDMDPATVTDTSPRTTSLTNFNGRTAVGQWTLFLADLQSGGSNELTQWSVTIIGAGSPTLTWANPANMVYGAALGASQLNATATYNSTNVPGTFTYTPPAGTVLHAGLSQTLSVTFTPTDTTSFLPVTTNVTINVAQATPVITWANPAGIVYGAALSGTQLDATANVPGAFVYSPVSGTVLHAGNGQSLSTTFTPTDTTDYTSAGANVTINVAQATPVITWANPAGIVYGTALSGTQLDATANVPGAFVYSPVSGTVLHAGNGQSLSTTFTPTDTTDYTSAGANVTINVAQATPVITWANPAGIVYGAALSGTQLDATANVPGAFVYSPVSGTVLHAGNGQSLSTTFTPTDTTDYTSAGANVTINVAQATPVITWANPAGIVYGAALSGTQLDATANVPGTFVYSPVSGTVLHAGNGQSLSTTFTPTDTTDYTSAGANVTINVAQATPVITWANPAGIVYGTALSGTQLDATANVPGTFVYSPVSGTILHAGNGQSLSTTFTPTDTTDYTSAGANVTINVAHATTTGAIVSSANPALPGANVTFTMTVSPVAPASTPPTGTVNFRINGTVGGTGTLSGGAAAFATNSLPHGSNTVVAEYAGDQNYVGITNSLAPSQVINTPPIAGNLTIQRYPALGAKVTLAAILASCSDADGDTLTITPASASANGATISVAQGWVFYTPAPGYTNTDSFTYTVSDAFGGSAVGTINVTVLSDTSVSQNLAITSLGGGSYLINGNGIPGYTYTLQHTPTLNPANWQNIPGGSVTADPTGAFQYTDTPTGGEGFYRTVYP